MKTTTLYTLTVLSLLALSACSEQYTPHNPSKPSIASQQVRQIAALAFVSYAGDDLINTDQEVNLRLEPCVAWELARQPVLNNQYQLAWGPSAHRFELAKLDDNMMYAAWDRASPGHLIIAIRGTNPRSISDWFGEDFFIHEMIEWPYAENLNGGAKISAGTDIGLRALQGLKGKQHCDDCKSPSSLESFLVKQAQDGNLKKITVTGHSLAGALAPTLALWLDSAVLTEKQFPQVGINVLAIAGATPGNAQFATLYDQALGASTNRVHNPFDTVPQSWLISAMHKLPSIYTTDHIVIRPSRLERAVFELSIGLAENKNYTHINASQASIGGVINPKALDGKGVLSFTAQAAWQHHCGYYNALQMTSSLFKVNSSCLSEQYCLQNPSNKDCAALSQPVCEPVQ